MRKYLHVLAFVALFSSFVSAEVFPTPQYFHRLFSGANVPSQLPGPEGLKDYVVDGKLRMTLEDAVRLALLNDTDTRLNQLQAEFSKFTLLRAYQPFDPVLTSSFGPSRSNSQTVSELDGASVLSNLTHRGSVTYNQAFQTGTSFSVGFNANRSATNSEFATVNPSIVSSLNFSLSQPLLRRRGLLANRAPIVIAQRNVKQSQAALQGQMNESVSRTINRYWDLVQSKLGLEVLQKSLELAEATYDQNKRALKLGALPQLDIYRSESQVAQRKLSVIQAQYRLKAIEDDFRRLIGADLDETYRVLPLELTERADAATLTPVDPTQALEKALKSRPELESLRQQAANDDLSIRVANQNLKPDLNLTGFYSTSGTNVLVDADNNRLTGHFGDAWDQVTSFKYPSYGATLELRLPLRNRAAEAELGSAQVSKRRTLYQIRQRQQAISLEVRNALNDLEGSRMSITAAETALDLAKKNLAAEQRKYELGAQTIFFVLDAQTQMAQAEQSLVEAQISYQRALTSVRRSTGELLDIYRVQIASMNP